MESTDAEARPWRSTYRTLGTTFSYGMVVDQKSEHQMPERQVLGWYAQRLIA
jgi:hypothetical protein